ncbi:MAG: LysR family transcriptional regulator [Pseudomonadota bacterium]
MDVRQLKCFLAIAQEGSISAAAAKLQLAQPSLSQHVAKLEEELGVQLLLRTPRGVTLTESGQTLAHHAQKILDEIALAEQDVRHFSGQPQGMVSIGLPSSLSMILSVPLAETVRHDFPNVTLRLVEAMSGDIQSWVADNSIDLGFLYDVQQLRHFNARPLFEEQLFLVSAPDNWAEPIDKSISLQSVGSLPLVLPSRKHGLREMIERFARAKNISLNVVLEIDALSQIKALVARASAYTILAHAAVLDEVERGDLIIVPIRDPMMTRVVSLVRNPKHIVTRASLEVEKLCASLIRELLQRRKWRAKSVEE